MKHNKKRISKIVDEMINFLFTIGGQDIDIHISCKDQVYTISLASDYKEEQACKLLKLKEYLECPKQEEMEEYYWELMGDCDIDTELSILGMMIDEFQLSYGDEELSLILKKDFR